MASGRLQPAQVVDVVREAGVHGRSHEQFQHRIGVDVCGPSGGPFERPQPGDRSASHRDRKLGARFGVAEDSPTWLRSSRCGIA